MIEALVKRNVGTDLYLLDAGLGVKDTLKIIIHYGKKYVTRSKKNFGVTHDHKYQFLTELYESIPLQSFKILWWKIQRQNKYMSIQPRSEMHTWRGSVHNV